MAHSLTEKAGFSLVEAVLAIGLFALVVTSFIGAIMYGEQSTVIAGGREKATYLAEEGLEAVRHMRDENFANLVDGTYGLKLEPAGPGNIWILQSNADTIDNFTRQMTVSTLDASTKNITATVTWQQTPQSIGTLSLSTHLTNWRTVFVQAPHLNVITDNVVAISDQASYLNLLSADVTTN